jgi:translation initiation factor IF-1
MCSSEIIQLDACVESVISTTAFRARLANGHGFVAYYQPAAAVGRRVELRPGQRIRVAMSPYDMSAGRVVMDGVELSGECVT